MAKVVLAVVAHPDDIEWGMAGTLFLLKQKGCVLHYMTVANGCYGTETYGLDEIIAIRKEEARAAAAFLGAAFHESIANDLEIFYTNELIRKMASVVRAVAPDILLTHPLEDYMEDHVNAARLACTAAFARSSVNFRTEPDRPAFKGEVAIYHSLPHGLRDRMNNPVLPELYVDISSVMDAKRAMISFHKSQEGWLASTQGSVSLGRSMENDGRAIGALSGFFEIAEGWSRHLHVGYSGSAIDPLSELLAAYVRRR